MVKLVWLVPAIPFAAGTVNLLLGRRLGKAAGWLAAAAIAASFVVSIGVLATYEEPTCRAVGASQAGDVVCTEELLREISAYTEHGPVWIQAGGFKVDFDMRIDALSITMILVVTGVALLIHVYSIGYMEDDPRFGRYFAYLNLFVGFMLILVLADNLLFMYIGWEGVGLCSYLLIGFWFEKQAASDAAKKAFIVTRIGDTFMLIGIAVAAVTFGTLNFDKMFGQAGEIATATLTAITILLFVGAIGKSAQFPLHVWLPDAMQGPTPVSALIHAATMVTAGVYMVARMHPLFTPASLAIVAGIGLLSAIYGALSSIGQDDIKRALAYSTMSQLGFMFFAAGMGAFSLAIVLLVVHAFYKSLMFLSAGSVMHGLRGETDMKKMGGLRRAMPLTALLFGIGALALSGLPPFPGYFSKDLILAVASETGREVAWLLALFGAFLSALYVARVWFLTFAGRRRGKARAHESPAIMLGPLFVLAVGALFGGLLSLSAKTGFLETFLEPVLGEVPEGHEGIGEPWLALVSVAAAAAGVLLAWWMYASGRVDWPAVRERQLAWHNLFANGWYVDQAYGQILQPSALAAARGFSAFDNGAVDGAVNGLGRATRRAGEVARVLQTGFVRTYALAIVAGLALVLFAIEAMR